MGAGFSKALAQPMAPARVVVANRSAERAAAVAEQSGADVVSLSRLDEELGMADIVLTSTSAARGRVGRCSRGPHDAITPQGGPSCCRRPAVPVTSDPAVADVEGVSLLDVEDVRGCGGSHVYAPAARSLRSARS